MEKEETLRFPNAHFENKERQLEQIKLGPAQINRSGF